MMLKTCIKCKKTKPISEFYPKRNQCKECIKEYRQKNKEKIKEYHKEHYQNNKGKLLQQAKEFYQNNKDKCKKYNKEYMENNKDKIQEYRENNKEKAAEYSREYQQNNKKKFNEYNKEYYQNNKEKINERHREYQQNNKEKRNENRRNRRKTDPKYKLNSNISRSISASLHGNKNGRHWEDLVGYTLDELKKHLEKQFTDGMDWDNYGEWHIDHRIPLSAFNFTKPEHIGFQRAWALENLQPLWAEENLSKTNKLFYDFQKNLAI